MNRQIWFVVDNAFENSIPVVIIFHALDMVFAKIISDLYLNKAQIGCTMIFNTVD